MAAGLAEELEVTTYSKLPEAKHEEAAGSLEDGEAETGAELELEETPPAPSAARKKKR